MKVCISETFEYIYVSELDYDNCSWNNTYGGDSFSGVALVYSTTCYSV